MSWIHQEGCISRRLPLSAIVGAVTGHHSSCPPADTRHPYHNTSSWTRINNPSVVCNEACRSGARYSLICKQVYLWLYDGCEISDQQMISQTLERWRGSSSHALELRPFWHVNPIMSSNIWITRFWGWWCHDNYENMCSNESLMLGKIHLRKQNN